MRKSTSTHSRPAALGAAALFTCLALLASGFGRAGAGGITPGHLSTLVELPVSFAVVNGNTSGIPCPADNAAYTIRGHITGPADALEDSGGVATLYLHGFNTGEWNWRFSSVTGISGYDFAGQMASLGNVSVTIDQLGYDASVLPLGYSTCVGAYADIAHQIVQQLRAGTYTVDGRPAVAFSTIIIGGHDVGGEIVEVEAYSYKDVDGVMVLGWAEQGFTDFGLRNFGESVAVCARGGESAETGTPGGGFAHYIQNPDHIAGNVFPYAGPGVRDAAVAIRNRNACGVFGSIITGSRVVNPQRLREITVPVLILYSDEDAVISQDGYRQQAAHFGSNHPDLTSQVFGPAGHFPMLEVRAADYAALLSGWIKARWS